MAELYELRLTSNKKIEPAIPGNAGVPPALHLYNKNDPAKAI